MASSDDVSQIYQQAVNAYAQQNYDYAATLVDEVVQLIPNDPNTHLLRGHVMYVLQKYDIATTEYEKVLELTDDPDITVYALSGIDSINQLSTQSTPDSQLNHSDDIDIADINLSGQVNFSDLVDVSEFDEKAFTNSDSPFGDIDKSGFDLSGFGNSVNIESQQDLFDSNPFSTNIDSVEDNNDTNTSDNPFTNAYISPSQNGTEESLEFPQFWTESVTDGNLNSKPTDFEVIIISSTNDNISTSHGDVVDNSSATKSDITIDDKRSTNLSDDIFDDVTIHISSNPSKNQKDINTDTLTFGNLDNGLSNDTINTETQSRNSDFSTFSIDKEPDEKVLSTHAADNTSSFDMNDSFDFEAFESAFGSESETEKVPISDDRSSKSFDTTPKSNNSHSVEFLEDFDAFDSTLR